MLHCPSRASALRRLTKSARSVSVWKICVRSMPRPITWCQVPGASSRGWRGMPRILPHFRIGCQRAFTPTSPLNEVDLARDAHIPIPNGSIRSKGIPMPRDRNLGLILKFAGEPDAQLLVPMRFYRHPATFVASPTSDDFVSPLGENRNEAALRSGDFPPVRQESPHCFRLSQDLPLVTKESPSPRPTLHRPDGSL